MTANRCLPKVVGEARRVVLTLRTVVAPKVGRVPKAGRTAVSHACKG